MKKITARITMSVDVTDEEYKEILNEIKDDDGDDFNLDYNDLLNLFKDSGYIDEDYGDSYIPGPWIEALEEE